MRLRRARELRAGDCLRFATDARWQTGGHCSSFDYGTNATALSQTIDVPESASAAQTSYVVQSLSAGTWYFAVSAYTSTGTESSRSNVGSKTIN